MKKKVCIIGSGNWGSAIAKIVGKNCEKSNVFDSRVTMYVYEEDIEGRKLTEIINTDHENVKYLPGHTLPSNVVAIADVVEAADDADMLLFVVPHQFIRGLCAAMKGKLKKDCIGISLIKGMDHSDQGLRLISDIIRELLSIDMSVLMGANIASEVAEEMFCETTIGSSNMANGQLFKKLLQTNHFRITVSDDPTTVEVCGALKNIVACGAGFVTGLGYGDNTRAAVIRLGLMEMIKFAKAFHKYANIPGKPPQMATFLESCGVADLVTTCYGGRNKRVSEAFAKAKGTKTLKELEVEMLNGQKLQGPHTAEEVCKVLKVMKASDADYPLFVAVYNICYKDQPIESFIKCLEHHPEHRDPGQTDIKCIKKCC